MSSLSPETLPTPLALATRRLEMAEHARERTFVAMQWWEVAIQLHASACMVLAHGLGLPTGDNWRLDRPTMGTWFEVSRRLLIGLASVDRGCGETLGRMRATGWQLIGAAVRARNEFAHGVHQIHQFEGAPAELSEAPAELMGTCDLLCGRSLQFVAEQTFTRQGSGQIRCHPLVGPLIGRQQVFDIPQGDGPPTGQVCLVDDDLATWRPMGSLLSLDGVPGAGEQILIYGGHRRGTVHCYGIASRADLERTLDPNEPLAAYLSRPSERREPQVEPQREPVEQLEPLRSGSGGEWFKGVEAHSGQKLVVYVPEASNLDDTVWEQGVFSEVEHPGVVSVGPSFELRGERSFVRHLCPGVPLRRHLDQGWDHDRLTALALVDALAAAIAAVWDVEPEASVQSDDVLLTDDLQPVIVRLSRPDTHEPCAALVDVLVDCLGFSSDRAREVAQQAIRPLPRHAVLAHMHHQPSSERAKTPRGPSSYRPDEAFNSQTIISRYPAPVAYAYQRFVRTPPGPERGRALFEAMERTLRYLVTVAACDTIGCAAAGQVDPAFLQHDALAFLRGETKMTLGMWVGALRELARPLGRADDAFVVELGERLRPGGMLDKEVFGWLVEHRNLAEHPAGGLRFTASEWEELQPVARGRLEMLLSQIGFLQRYPLGFASLALGGKDRHRYRLYPCTGASTGATRPSRTVEVGGALEVHRPFLASPKDNEVLYLWPLAHERREELAQRPTLYMFEAIAGTRGRYLTRVRTAAIDVRDTWEVENHPKAQSSFGWLLCEARTAPCRAPVSPAAELSRVLNPVQPGQLVGVRVGDDGEYRLVSVLGSGGFATVYEAVHADERRLAVKVIDRGATRKDLQRFLREYDRLGPLSGQHRGFVRCYDRGLYYHPDDGQEYPWYAMELAVGGDLGDVLAQRRPSPDCETPWQDPTLRPRIEQEFSAITAAASALHDLEVVHRDLKPSNVLVMEDGQLKLGDLGLIKNLNPSNTSLDDQLSSVGATLGTPAYMAPELFQGAEATTRSDVFALGVILVELAAGQRPKISASGGGWLIQPPAFQILPKPLRKLIARCTADEPEGRLPDAAAVQEAFARVCSVG